MDAFRRKTPEEILESITKLHRGKLKILIGPFSGSGKTYHMLREGQMLKQQGIDVVICAVSTLRRPETVKQLGDLERIPSIHWWVGEDEWKDLNLEAILERNPEVLLVDGLAHVNRPDAQYRTRLEDIKVLLTAGISVITTVNVYELSGYTEIARKLTGIKVKHTVPADTLELADEVRLMDVTPETILNRLAEGHVHIQDASVLKRGNLSVLRELALRLVAEDVNESLEEHREQQGLSGPSGAAERILVTTQYHWNGSIYVRRGQQIAKRLNGELLVVTFQQIGRPMPAEAVAFKRSLKKLVDKIGGHFEELPIRNRRRLPAALIRYAAEKNVTRIILGHTQQSKWQQWSQGSIVENLLQLSRQCDLFFVADRTKIEGERVLPAKMIKDPLPQNFHRLTEQEVESQVGSIRRGTFKVYIGAAPGVGKTYMMLREGNDLLGKSIDVRIGLLETHNRRETMEQVGELHTIPRQQISYQDSILEEMDLDAILQAQPEVVLVDELAHTNVVGSRNKKRFEDVMELLNAGISVISTMNVQHLESLNDAVEQITGIRVRETVPDRVLKWADEVQLIDVSPESLQQRMREGKIYANSKIQQALNHFFKMGNLIALRELALREIADDVDERLESQERNTSLRGPWRRREVIFVCVELTPHAAKLIRRGFRTAHRLKADWYVCWVDTEGLSSNMFYTESEVSESSFSAKGKYPRGRVEHNGMPCHSAEHTLQEIKRLTEQLGGTFLLRAASHQRHIANELTAAADEVQATQLVMGFSSKNLLHRLWQHSVVRVVLRSSRHRDVLIVAQ
ncbi:two-component system sensor histidine kinase KdpD [Paenibacillus shirakamiensis]|uniref:Two-component system sensor histidine kinase KdpD n=1 Tax=Paenibacillus shirakamiensis TaxID=1265935 RepID=A0ABS4JL15_9BACL|nr:universal stress protein [Paenibacillus shirakamiensis]MBP2002407.1 two-component system sensor histidine kinase KdpD [Paenibacillus shirakamiensis]